MHFIEWNKQGVKIMQFDVVKTNIVNIAADAIVLPANERLKEGSGTSKAIFKAAGRKNLKKVCKNIGHCDTGSSVPTLAYNLNAKYIIHSVVPRWIDGKSGEYDLLSSAYLSALNIADVMGCMSIAFPLLASGNNRFDKELAVQIAKESIEYFSGANLQKITLVVYDDETENLMKSMGYSVVVTPENMQKDERKALKKTKQTKLLEDGKEIIQGFLEEALDKAIEWLKDEENQKKMIQFGVMIAKEAFKQKSSKKKLPKK